MYIILCSRFDICFAIRYLGRFQSDPSKAHWQALKRITRYLKGTRNKTLRFERYLECDPIDVYVDSD